MIRRRVSLHFVYLIEMPNNNLSIYFKMLPLMARKLRGAGCEHYAKIKREKEMNLSWRQGLVAATVLATAAFVSGSANAVPCPNINGITTCNVIITAGPGGTFVTTVPDPNPYDGADDNLVGIVNNSGSANSVIVLRRFWKRGRPICL